MGTDKKETRGRKPLAESERKTKKLDVRFSENDIKHLKQQAETQAVDFSTYIRQKLNLD